MAPARSVLVFRKIQILRNTASESPLPPSGPARHAGRRLPDFLRFGEPTRLLSAAETDRDRAMLALGLYCGLRVSEMAHLMIADVDLRTATLAVRHGKGDRDRFVPFAPAATEPLRAVMSGHRHDEPVLRSRSRRQLTTRMLQYRFAELAELAGLRHVHPHMARHTYATELLQTGADITEVRDLLGHTSILATEVYLHCVPERLRHAVDRLDWQAQ